MEKTMAKKFIGTEGNDYYEGENGVDDIQGLGGNDHLLGLGQDDVIDGGEGDDRLKGGTGDDLLIGGLGNDILVAGAGLDTLIGGLGRDTYNLGFGSEADTVVIQSVAETTLGLVDRVNGFVAGQDKIDISALVTAGADFQIVNGASASAIKIDGNGNGLFNEIGIDGRIQVGGAPTLAVTDLIT